MKSDEQVLIGIDIGTTSVKVIAVGAESGRCLATRGGEYLSSAPAPRAHEQNPADWWRILVESSRSLLEQISAERVIAVGLSGHMHSLLLLDEHDEPIGAALTWADRRIGEDTARLAGNARFRDVAGNGVVDAFTAPKLSWLARTRPEEVARARRLVLAKDYVRLRLTGVWSTDPTDAIGTLLYDVTANAWDDSLWQAVGVASSLAPPVLGSAEVAGQITAEAAKATGIPQGTPVVSGAGDVVAAVLGAGVVRADQICINVGTAAQVMALSSSSDVGEHFLFGAPLGHGFTSMAPVYAAGASIRWFEQAFLSGGRIEQVAAQSEPGAKGLGYLPFMFGMAVPVKNDAAHASYFNQGETHSLPDFARATLEGVAFGCADAIEAIAAPLDQVSEVRVVGGVSRSPLWCEALAAVLDIPIVLAEDGGSAMGAAILAGLGSGVWSDADSAAAALSTSIVAPSQSRERDLYRTAYAAYRAEARRGIE